MRSLRLVPYWSVHETLGVDAHNAPLKMRTRRIHLSRAVAWSCGRRHPVARAALGSTDVEGSDPPGRGPGAGAGPCVFSHAGPAPWGVTPVQISLAGRPPSAAEDAADQFPGQPLVELWGIAGQDRGRLAVAQLTPPRDRPLHHRRDPLPQPTSPPDASRSRLETAPQHLRDRLLNVGTELRNGPGITARTGHLAAGQRRLPTRPNGFVREKAQEFIQQIMEEEVTELLGREKSERRSTVDSAEGYRNGYGKPRRLAMSSGTITLRRPRVRGVEERFESRVLPLFARRTKELGALLAELYLHGLAEGDFELAMRGLLGEGAPLSKSSIRRLRAGWTAEFEEWSQRRLEGREVVYVWADGIYVKAGLERDKAALLVVLGAMRDGTKEVLALRSGYRESVESWSEVLRDLKARGIEAPRLLMADGNAAIWGAVRQVWPEAGEQRCWNHKMRNVLDRLPQREQSEAKDLLRAVVYAPSRAEAVKGREVFARRYRPWYPKAVDVLEDDWERMVAFYDFPEDHWKHLRTTNVVESPFAALRLRTTAAKRFKRVESATALIWKLLLVADKRFRRLDAPHLLKDVFEERKFEDGKPVSTQQRKNAA